MMIGILGSEEDFEYQYGTKFSASDKCLVSRETLTRVHDRVNMFVNKDLDISLVHKNNLLWKEDFDLALLKTGYFVITIDLSEGGGSDSTVFTIFRDQVHGIRIVRGICDHLIFLAFSILKSKPLVLARVSKAIDNKTTPRQFPLCSWKER